MKIGDIEYTRKVGVLTDTLQESEFTQVNFALGIQIRPLLTRVSCYLATAQAVTGNQIVFLENGDAIAETQTAAALIADARALPIHDIDTALSTNGMGFSWPHESTWWKILLPTVRIHLVATVLSVSRVMVLLHYRFAELTADEIVEIAAQRAQS